MFRHGDMSHTLELLKTVALPTTKYGFKSTMDLDYALRVQSTLDKMQDIAIRVESPWISVYTNNIADVDALTSIDVDRVKYVSAPPTLQHLKQDTLILPKVPFEFRVTLGKCTQNHQAFIDWAEVNPKVRLTKGCKKDLSKDRSWGGTYFYVSGNNNLLLAKMHLGGSISKIEHIVKQ